MLKLAQAGLLPGMLGIQPWPVHLTDIRPPCGIDPSQWDAFHELVVQDEVARCASGGIMLGLAGYGIALPPVVHFGSDELKRKVRDVVDGKQIICLNVTEPYAGSDVAGLRCTATLTPDGKHYIVNGEKVWMSSSVSICSMISIEMDHQCHLCGLDDGSGAYRSAWKRNARTVTVAD